MRYSLSIVCVNVEAKRTQKEVVHQYIKKVHLPYTIIDVGMWYQATFPQLPSGRVEYAMTDCNTTVFSGGETKTALIDRPIHLGTHMYLTLPPCKKQPQKQSRYLFL